MKSIKVLGPGCKKCKQLELNVREAASKLQREYSIEKIEDIKEMTKYGMMATPGLVLNEKLFSSGKVQTIDELMEILK